MSKRKAQPVNQAQQRNQQVTIDAIESTDISELTSEKQATTGRMARVELPDGTTQDMPLSELPKGVQEGDVVTLGELPTIDHAQTAQRRVQAQQQLEALNSTAPTGDIEL